MFYKLDEKTLQVTLNYLASKPYAEVRDLVALIQQAEKIEEPATEEVKEDKKKA